MRIAPLLLLSVVALAACGGSRGPTIDAAVATKLARQADAIASAGDRCAARTHARILQRQTIAATNAGKIPAAYQETLVSRVNELVDELALSCLPAPSAAQPTAAASPPPAPVPAIHAPRGHGKHGDDHGRGHGHGHGHGKGHDK